MNLLTFVTLTMSFFISGVEQDVSSRIFDGSLDECNAFVFMVAMDPAVENFQQMDDGTWVLYGTELGEPAEIHAKCESVEVEEQG